jgi:uncharacterized protein YbjT (DUF2867 family)
MKILVTGGTGVIGEALIPLLVEKGHAVRLLSRHATEDSKQWKGVEAFDGDVAAGVTGAASGCDAVLHIAGVASGDFETVNVGGTRNVIDEAKRAQVRTFVYVSSLGADAGTSDYHQSKLAAEQLVERSGLDWTIVRPGGVYGPGDEVVSVILKMVRLLPVVPVVSDGTHEFQPIWHEDLAEVLATTVERDDLRGQTLEVAGADVTSMNDLLERFAKITDRRFLRVPVPMTIVQLATKVASAAVDIPIDETKLAMLRDRNVLRGRSALDLLGVTATPLEEGLRKLADALPEVLPEDGFGSMEHKHVFADIRGTRHTAASLLAIFRERTNEVMPIEFAAEPGAPEQVEDGATMTGTIPGRGNIQVRVERDEPTRIVFGTIEGHPLAGIVEFSTSENGGAVRFAVDTWTRASNVLDWLAMNSFGWIAQTANWRGVVQRMIELSGGTSDGVHEEAEKLDEAERERVEKRVREMVQSRKREETSAPAERPAQR